jgi:hypothetical protein
VSQGELGLALIAARDTPNSIKSLAELIRFRLDAGLAEDYDCVVLKKGKIIRKWVATLEPSAMREQCIKDYLSVTKSNMKIFPPSDIDFVCRKTDEIEQVRKQTLEMLNSGHHCPS